MMMFHRRRASPKHYNDMTEVEYGGRGHRTRLRNDHEDQLVCSRVPPASVYKGVEEGSGQGGWRALGGSPTPTGSRTPLFPIRSRRGKEEEGGRKERGGRPPSQFGLGLGGAPSVAPFPSFPLKPIKAHIAPGGFR